MRSSIFLARAVRFALLSALISLAMPAQGLVTTTSSKGIFPNDGIDDTVKLNQALGGIANNTTLHFDQPGTYEVTGPMGSGAILTLTGKSDIGITAVAGVRIELTGYDRSATNLKYPDLLRVTNCHNVTIAGAGATAPLVFDTRGAKAVAPGNEGLPFLQGTVLSVTSSTTQNVNKAQLKITDGEMFLPTTCTPHCWGAWQVSPNSAPKFDIYDGTIMPLGTPAAGAQIVEIQFPLQSWVQPFANWGIGEQVVVVLNKSNTYAVTVFGCTGNTVIRDLLANSLPGKFLTVSQCENVLVDNADARPATPSRLLSVDRDGVNADALHVEVRNCDLSYTGDDAIVSNGTAWGTVVPGSFAGGPGNQFKIAPPLPVNHWPTTCRPGQVIALLDGKTLSNSTAEWAVISTWPEVSDEATGARLKYTFSTCSTGFIQRLLNASASTPAVTFNPSYSMGGSIVDSCSATVIRGVGVTVRSVNTTVSSCMITDTMVAGIHAGGGFVDSYPWFAAGAPPHNLLVQYCYLTRCAADPDVGTKGAIEIAVAMSSTPNHPPGGNWNPCLYWINPVYSSDNDVIQNVTINGNVIQDFPRAGIFAANVGGPNGIQITNNWFFNSGAADACHPEHGHCVALETCKSGLIQFNQYANYFGKYWQHASGSVVWLP